jgi:hypothetical protein
VRQFHDLLAEIPLHILGEVDLGLPSAAYRVRISGGFIHNMVASSMCEIVIPRSSPIVDDEDNVTKTCAPPSTLTIRIPSQMFRTAFPSIVDVYEASTMETLLPKTRKVGLKSANSVSEPTEQYYIFS